MDPELAILEVEEAMTKCVDYLTHEFAGVRTGKASPALIENIDVHVQAYGAISKLKSLAVISSPEPRMLMVQPFDPSTTRDVPKFCLFLGHELLARSQQDDRYHYLIRKA